MVQFLIVFKVILHRTNLCKLPVSQSLAFSMSNELQFLSDLMLAWNQLTKISLFISINYIFLFLIPTKLMINKEKNVSQ